MGLLDYFFSNAIAPVNTLSDLIDYVFSDRNHDNDNNDNIQDEKNINKGNIDSCGD